MSNKGREIALERLAVEEPEWEYLARVFSSAFSEAYNEVLTSSILNHINIMDDCMR